MGDNILAIDQGTSGTKAVVFCPERGIIATGQAPVRPRYGEGDRVEQDPAELLASVLDAGRQAVAAAGEPIVALGLANQGETVLAWDRSTGIPLTDAVVWQDRRSQPVCDELGAAAGRLAELTGLPLDPYFAAPKMAWLRRHVTRDGVVTTSDAWLVHQLTGEFVTDASTASRTMLLDLDSTQWSAEAADVFGLGEEQLPTVVDAAGTFGETTAFGPKIPLMGLLVDQQAALLAEGCLDEGSAKCTYGTGAFLLANTGLVPRRSRSGLVSCVAWRLAGVPTYCLDGQVLTVGSAVRWMTDLGVIGGAPDLDRVGATVTDAGGVTLVPAFAGLAAPTWRGDVRAALVGLSLATTAGHLVRALCDGVCAEVAGLAVAVGADLGHQLTSLRVDGGLTRSRLLMQTQADLLQLPVEVYAGADATALGVAAAVRMGLDAGLQPVDALPSWQPETVYQPATSADEAADRLASYDIVVRRLMAEPMP
ncbi:MAG: FGGY family carbohydrate kinase [Candidatus Nanopelagicales bacterium]